MQTHSLIEVLKLENFLPQRAHILDACAIAFTWPDYVRESLSSCGILTLMLRLIEKQN